MSTLKAFQRGTHRVVSPGETLSRVRGLFAPVGITRVANVTGLDCVGIPVVMVSRPNARSLAVSQGKGLDIDAARASGVMEAIELYHAERITEPLKLASWNELRFSHRLVRVEALPRVSSQSVHRDRAMLWIAGVELFSSEAIWVPYELIHTNYTLPATAGSGSFVMSSNGLASGNHRLEAVSHALCEVIERDATTLFHCKGFAERDALRVDVNTVKDADCLRLLDLYARAAVAVGVWDVTSDVGIATFLCIVVDREPNPFRAIGPVEGMGCHAVREVALLRALTEAAQARLTLVAGSRDDNGRGRYKEAQDNEFSQRARARLLQKGTRPFEQTTTRVNDTLEADVAMILGALHDAGFEHVVLVDLTKPELLIPVVRVVVPGLEPYHHVPGYIPGQRALRLLGAAAGERER